MMRGVRKRGCEDDGFRFLRGWVYETWEILEQMPAAVVYFVVWMNSRGVFELRV